MKVYYNSGCPVCKAGIERQKGIPGACDIRWNDVHQDNKLADETGAELEFVRKRLHVIDERGRLCIGFDAFLAIWRNTPADVWKARLFGWPPFRVFGRVGYNLFAAALYRWNRAKGHW